ncbi:tyrosine-type recombinase/integrase [Nostoc sphaeroides]|uniref:Integrase n=1 Tax=Nostoc sphaeroides CCNUC1 TaxID=2653204 RepID=A0A5P8WI16_9NOSO|nr:tyrosine-type recombinase/integrase [Nostoc sphaeroides]QFS52354.1 Integrase [Nostoc sphaeroides CCNUC1]
MIEIDWQRDYNHEFVCPYCEKVGLRLRGKGRNNKRRFSCPYCQKRTIDSCQINFSNSLFSVNWKKDYKVGDFVCPHENCNSKDVRLAGQKSHKKRFKCQICGSITQESCDLTAYNVVSRLSNNQPNIKQFSFNDEKWDLRGINPSYNGRSSYYCVHFDKIKLDWFRVYAKQHIYHLCKINTPLGTIDGNLCSLRIFSRYLAEKGISGINEVNRSLILDFINWDKTTNDGLRIRLGGLRNFFITGKIRGWFEIDQDIIRDDDYPKRKLKTPDPIPDGVREQIEKNLHKLPDPFARMWLISFFTAMRPAELALLKKDCLIQEGGIWKIIFDRPKNKEEQRQIFITRTIAEVVQEQQAYIQELWGDEWEYLFCYYRGLSDEDPTQPNLKAIKKVIPQVPSIFSQVIRCLIQAEDIRDENGKLAKFNHRLIRPTRLTQLYNLGHDITVVQHWAGHKKYSTTARYYTKITPEKFKYEIGHIQQALFNADGKYVAYDSLPKSFWQNRKAHQLHPPHILHLYVQPQVM